MILELENINKLTKNEGFTLSNVTTNFNIFLIASKFQKESKTIFVVLDTLYEAQQYYDKLINMLSPEEVLFYPSDELITELLNVLVSVKSTGENIKYLATALVAALKDLKLTDEKLQKKKDKYLGFLNLVNAFIGGKVKFEYDAKVLKGEGEKSVEKLPGGAEGFKRQLSGYHGMATGAGQQMVKPAVDGMGLTATLKSLNLDTISIAAGVPKYQNGFALVLTLPGLSKVLEELLK